MCEYKAKLLFFYVTVSVSEMVIVIDNQKNKMHINRLIENLFEQNFCRISILDLCIILIKMCV